jgi:hypothetical protein
MAKQNQTKLNTDTWELTPAQQQGVDLLVSGQNICETAQALGVTRQTVAHWLHTHPGFQAEVNQRRQELWV